MFGWLEAGGSTNGLASSFYGTNRQDVVLRSALLSNKVVIGNSNNTTAAMYVMGNNVGFKTLPNPHYTVDIHGSVHCDGVYQCDNSNLDNHTSFDATSIAMWHGANNNIGINAYGLVRGQYCVTKEIKQYKASYPNVRVIDVYVSNVVVNNIFTSGYSIIIQGGYATSFAEDNVLLIGDIMFKLATLALTSNGTLRLDVVVYIEEQRAATIPFQPNDYIDIHVLEDFTSNGSPGSIQNEYTRDVLDFQQMPLHACIIDQVPGKLVMELTYDHTTKFLIPGYFYHFKTSYQDTEKHASFNVDNIMLLEGLASSGANVNATFRSLDPDQPVMHDAGLVTLLSELNTYPTSIFIFALDALDPPPIVNESGAYIGFFTDGSGYGQKVAIKNSQLVASSLWYPRNSTHIQQIAIDGVHYHVDSICTIEDCAVVAMPQFEDADPIFTRTCNLRYSYDILPLQILSVVLVDEITLEMNVFTPFHSQLASFKDYISRFIYLVDNAGSQIWRVQAIVHTPESSIAVLTISSIYGPLDTDASPKLLDTRCVYALPFKVTNTIELGDQTDKPLYVPTSLGIGTQHVKERLTVDGDASFKNRVVVMNDNSVSTFEITHDSNVTNVNNQLRFAQKPEMSKQPSLYVTATTRFDAGYELSFLDEAFNYVQIAASSLQINDVNNHGVKLTSYGEIQSDVVVGDYIKNNILSLTNVHVIDVQPASFQDNDNVTYVGYTLAIDSQYMPCFSLNDHLRISDQVFRVVSFNTSMNTLVLKLQPFLGAENEVAFEPGFTITIGILRESCDKVGVDGVNFPVTLESIEYVYDEAGVPTQLRCNVFMQHMYMSYMNVGSYYQLSQDGLANAAGTVPVKNVVLLTAWQVMDACLGKHVVEFKAVNNIDNLHDLLNDIVYTSAVNVVFYMHQFETIFSQGTFNYTDHDVIMGYHTTSTGGELTFYDLHDNADMTKLFAGGTWNRPISAIDHVKITYFDDSFDIVNVGGEYIDAGEPLRTNILLRKPFSAEDSSICATTVSVSYTLNGAPWHIKVATIVSSYNKTVGMTYVVDLNNAYKLSTFVGAYIYIMDQTCEAWQLTECEVLSPTQVRMVVIRDTSRPVTSADLECLCSPRYIFAIPLRYCKANLLGSAVANNYTVTPVGINTNMIKETLTVYGNISFKNEAVMYDAASSTPCVISYASNVLSIADAVSINSNLITMNKALLIDGDIVASAFYNRSDKRFKKDVKVADSYTDLMDLLKVPVVDYKFVDDDTTSLRKGVIAQDIEQMFPNIVSDNITFAPVILANGVIDEHGDLHLDRTTFVDGGIDVKFEEGQKIKLRYVDETMYHIFTIVTTTEKGNDIIFKLSLPPTHHTRVFVYGIELCTKAVDYNYLFVMCINSIKALHAEVDSLKRQLKHQ